MWLWFNVEIVLLEYVFLIILMVNEKFRENVLVWVCFYECEDVFFVFFNWVLFLKDDKEVWVMSI